MLTPDDLTATISVNDLIIGAGLTGLSAGYSLENKEGKYMILESNPKVGGKASSEYKDGFTFDITGHWLHLRNLHVKKLVHMLCGADHFIEVQRISSIWSQGCNTRYPFQANLYGLPSEVIKECLLDIIHATYHPPAQEPHSFQDWLRAYFGKGIAQHFMIPYNRKLWGSSFDSLTSEWCQRFIPKPNLEEVISGAIGSPQNHLGYNVQFLYPRKGGIQSLSDALYRQLDPNRVCCSASISEVNLKKRYVTLQNGTRIQYTSLVNTSPLPLFLDLCAHADVLPLALQNAQQALKAIDVVYLNVAIMGSLSRPDHWVYIPDSEWPIYRIGSFTNANPAMAPEGCASLYIELSDRTSSVETLRPCIEKLLVDMHWIQDPSQIIFIDRKVIPNAYVVYDQYYSSAKMTIHKWLGSFGVSSIGRYGDWNYSSMEDALIAGLTVGQQSSIDDERT